MVWTDLKQKEKAPEAGCILAYTSEKVIFHPYQNISELEQELQGIELLELHLFDSNKEYRSVATKSKRFSSGVIEYVADFSEQNEDSIYAETVLLEKQYACHGYSKLTILNHIEYDPQSGMAVINDYRLRY